MLVTRYQTDLAAVAAIDGHVDMTVATRRD
jgi:hypothetical protein